MPQWHGKSASEYQRVLCKDLWYEAGLAQATRFSLDRCVILPWAGEWFHPSTAEFTFPVMGHFSSRSQEFLRLLIERRRTIGRD